MVLILRLVSGACFAIGLTIQDYPVMLLGLAGLTLG